MLKRTDYTAMLVCVQFRFRVHREPETVVLTCPRLVANADGSSMTCHDVSHPMPIGTYSNYVVVVVVVVVVVYLPN